MKTENPIDSLFQQKLEGHQLKASEQVWKKVAAAQSSPAKKLGLAFFMRAASVALLIGLSGLFYFNNNTARLMNLRMERDLVPEVQTDFNPTQQTIEITSQSPLLDQSDPKEVPKKAVAEKPKKQVLKPAKKTKARVIPILKTFTANPYLALNDTEMPGAEILGMEEVEVLKKGTGRVKIKVQLPGLKAYYGPDTTAPKSAELGERLWAYASNQLDRIVAGERPSLPTTKPEITIPLPDFINRQFSKAK
jgi:hypothetical protein